MPGKARRSYHHGDLRAALLEAAPGLIVEAGLDGFTIRELARRLGVSHGAAYRHFSNKNALLAALAIEGHTSLCAAFTKATGRQKTLAGAIRAAAKAQLRWARAHPGHYQVMYGPRLNEDGGYPELEDAIEASLAATDAIFLAHGARKARARELSVALMTQMHGYCELVRLRRIRVRDGKAADAFLARILSPFIDGVCAELGAA